MEAYTETVIDSYGNKIVGATVSVYDDLVLATIYSDNGITPKANPFETTNAGLIQFYAASGRYDVKVSHPQFNNGNTLTIPIILNDLTTSAEEAAASAEADRIAAEAAALAASIYAGSAIGVITVPTIAGLRLTSGEYDGQLAEVAGYYSEGDGGGGPLRMWDASSTASDDGGSVIAVDGVVTGRWVFREYYSEVNPEWWGANTIPGTTDMTAEVLAALDYAPVVYLPAGVYAVSAEIPLINGRKLRGAGVTWWQDPSSPPDGSSETIIKYIGAGGANSCVVRMSTESVGTKPTHPTGNNFGVGIKDIIIDGNNLAEIGVYSARSGLNSLYENVIATGTKKHGFWFGEFWTCATTNLSAIHNYGRGFTIGESSNSVTSLGFWANNIVNATAWNSTQSFLNGRDLEFNDGAIETESLGCGIAFFGARTNVFYNPVVELNDGVGFYWSPISGPNRVIGLYSEDNGKVSLTGTPRASRGYSIYVRATTGNVQAHFESLFKGGSTSQYIYLTGTMTTNPVDGMVFNSIFGGMLVNAEWGNYSLISAASSTTNSIEGHFPANNPPDSINPSPAVTTLYVDDTASGIGSGRDTSNYFGSIADALAIAKVVKTITTINISAITGTPAAARILDGFNLSRRISIVGGGTGRLNSVSGVSAYIFNFNNEIVFEDIDVIEFISIKDSKVSLKNIPVIRMDISSTEGAAIVSDNSNVQILGTTSINLTASSALTKIGAKITGGSTLFFSGNAADVIIGETSLSNVVFDGVGSVLDSTGWRLSSF